MVEGQYFSKLVPVKGAKNSPYILKAFQTLLKFLHNGHLHIVAF